MKKLKLIAINFLIFTGLIAIILLATFFYSKQQINDFFEIKSANHDLFLQKDSLAMFIQKPNLLTYDNWGTPNQKISGKRTNNLGFRESKDIIKKKENEFRILVTGDSHTQGSVKNNEDTFVNILELDLNNASTHTFYNCLNGGTAFYTFRNYAGLLKKSLPLKPDMFIVNIFTGNDFRETILFEDDRTSFSNIYKYTYNKTARKFYNRKQRRLIHNQGVEQINYFKYFKEDIAVSLKHSKKYLTEIIKICKAHKIELIVTLLPSKIETNASYKKFITSKLHFSNENTSVNTYLTQNLQKWLEKNNVRYYNLLKPLKASHEKLYWDHDLHINNNAHRIIGHYLFKQLKLN